MGSVKAPPPCSVCVPHESQVEFEAVVKPLLSGWLSAVIFGLTLEG